MNEQIYGCLTIWRNPCNMVLLVKLIITYLVKQLSSFYGTHNFIISLLRSSYLSLPWAKSIQSMRSFHFLKIFFFFSILRSVPESTKWSLFLRFFNQMSACNFSLPMCLKCHDCPILLDFIMQKIFVGEQKSWKSSLCTLLCSPAASSFWAPFISLSPLFSNTVSLYSFIPVREQVAHPCITTNKVIILYILIFVLTDNKVTDKVFCTEWEQAFPKFNLLLIFFMNGILICQDCSQISELLRIFKGFSTHLYIVNFSAWCSRDMIIN